MTCLHARPNPLVSQMLAKLLVLLQLCSVAYSSSDGGQAIDVTKPIWPFAYDWGKFPAGTERIRGVVLSVIVCSLTVSLGCYCSMVW
jgi:hypothetical protein